VRVTITFVAALLVILPVSSSIVRSMSVMIRPACAALVIRRPSTVQLYALCVCPVTRTWIAGSRRAAISRIAPDAAVHSL